MLNKDMVSINTAAAFGTGALMYVDTALSKFGLKAILDNDKHFIEPEPGRFARQIITTVVQMANALNIHIASPVEIYDIIRLIQEKFPITRDEEILVIKSLFSRQYLSDVEMTDVVVKWLKYIEKPAPRIPVYMYRTSADGDISISAALDDLGWQAVLETTTNIFDDNSPSKPGTKSGWNEIIHCLVDKLAEATRTVITDDPLDLRAQWASLVKVGVDATGLDHRILDREFSNLLKIDTDVSDAELDGMVECFLKRLGIRAYSGKESTSRDPKSLLAGAATVLKREYRTRRDRLVDLLILRQGKVADEVMETYGHEVLDEYVRLYGVLNVADLVSNMPIGHYQRPSSGRKRIEYKGLITPNSIELVEALQSRSEELIDAVIIQRCVAFSYGVHVTETLSRDSSTSVGLLMSTIDTLLGNESSRGSRSGRDLSDEAFRGMQHPSRWR